MTLRVSILIADVGGGHRSVARAIGESIAELAGPAACTTEIDVYAPGCSRPPLTLVPFAYHQGVTRLPSWCFALFYRLLDGRRSFGAVERLAQPLIQPGLRRALAAARPDVVVRALPGLGTSVAGALDAIGSDVPIVTVVTDLVTVHRAWITGRADAYLAPTAPAAAACAAAGVRPERIHTYGLPVGRAFCRPERPRAALRASLGLDPERPAVLVMGGGEGGGRLDAIARALAGRCPAAQIVVIAGRNRRVQRRLAAEAPPGCRVLGRVANVAEWMHASDLLVTKAGPSTAMEAVCAGLPMVLTGGLPQEEGTLSYLIDGGAAAGASGPDEIAGAAADLLDRPERRAAMVAAGARLARPRAARDTAAFILRVARGARSEADAAAE